MDCSVIAKKYLRNAICVPKSRFGLREARKVNVGDFRLKLPCNSGQKGSRLLAAIKLTEVYNHLEEFFCLLMGKLLTCDDVSAN